MAITERYGAHNYHPMPVNIVRAEGVFVWDGSGKQYIDCVGAYSAVAHGHQNPAVVRALIEQLGKIALTSRAFYTTEVALFIQALAEYSEMDVVCPMNTGAEAVETCIKLARKWAYKVKGVPDGQAEIIACNDNFHGRTTTIVGFSTEQQYKDGFGPFTPGFKVIPFGDIDALRTAITPNTAAFLCEPIQAEGGIIIPPDGWMAAVRKLCDENNVLLVWDEVQSGFCRTGRKFAWMYEDAKPDLMCVGKPLGGGLLPVSAAIGSSEVMEMFTPGDHGSTFGGNPLGAAVALAGLAEMETKRYAERSERLGNRLMAAFRAWDIPNVIDVRGRGLLVGVEVAEGVDTERLVDAFLQNGILTKETRSRTFRFAPPITIEDAQIDEIVKRAEATFRSVC
ncbi:MAG: ornithine--oxo-acid transaminase [Armatimonadetes bacterium]|nr:ornithine--oxo-acid transaminase [Armatimonadota bacterium]